MLMIMLGAVTEASISNHGCSPEMNASNAPLSSLGMATLTLNKESCGHTMASRCSS